MLARMAGLSCGKEVSNLMLHSGKRPDVVLFQYLFNILIDVRTVAGADPRYCRAAALNPTAFKVYALQRLHAATFRGVAAMINARPIWRMGPGIFPGQAVSPRGRRSAFHLTGASCPVFLLAQSK